MAKVIQIRDVPDAVHRSLVVRAAEEQMSLSAYALRELTRAAERPTMQQMLDRLGDRPGVVLDGNGADAVRAGRADHE